MTATKPQMQQQKLGTPCQDVRSTFQKTGLIGRVALPGSIPDTLVIGYGQSKDLPWSSWPQLGLYTSSTLEWL